jgi:hypothetical protein
MAHGHLKKHVNVKPAPERATGQEHGRNAPCVRREVYLYVPDSMDHTSLSIAEADFHARRDRFESIRQRISSLYFQ